MWRYNSYPGARVDSEYPFYQLSIPEVFRSYNFTERFPNYAEIRDYFEHVDKVLDVRKDITFNAEVTSAEWDDKTSRWTVRTEQGHTATCKYLLLCTGSTYKKHVPDWPGLSAYKGQLYHTARWPSDGLDVSGKKVAVVGQGATGVQVVQELAKQAGELTVFLRTPNQALPMRQSKVDRAMQDAMKGSYVTLFKASRDTQGGFAYKAPPEPSSTALPIEQRHQLFEELYQRGGFNLVASVWQDYFFDPVANRTLYDFWTSKTRPRINNQVKRDILAPVEPPHPWMTKRPSLEQDYYECMDRDNVKLVDMKTNDIASFTETGIKTTDGSNLDFDLVVLATGFDNYTGAFHTMGLKHKDSGKDLGQIWKGGVRTYCGLMAEGYPNMWMVYGPQGTSSHSPTPLIHHSSNNTPAPTALGNGPAIIEVQIDIIISMLEKMISQNLKSIAASPAGVEEWTNDIHEMAKLTFMPTANSWYMGANIPGKKREMLNYLKGLNVYEKEVRATFEGEVGEGWKGWDVKREEMAADF